MVLAKWRLQRQIDAIKKNGLYNLLEKAAEKHNLPLSYVLAVASRETNMRNMLGDGGHGVGIIQIDIRYHEIARIAKKNGSWQTTPNLLIDYGVAMLKGNYTWARLRWPQDTFKWAGNRAWLKIAASAYNAGRGGAGKGVAQGDSDIRTTGGDYGKDVLARMATIKEIIGEAS